MPHPEKAMTTTMNAVKRNVDLLNMLKKRSFFHQN